MSQITLSVIIPAYNEEHYLKRCLQALGRQTRKPDEVLVIDNNSKDNTAAIASQFTRVRVITEKTQGVLFATRRGFNEASGDIICRIDADTVLPPNWLRQIDDYMVANPDIAAVTGHCYFYDFPFKKAFRIMHHAVYYQLQKVIAGTEVLWGSNMAMRRSAWLSVRQECTADPTIHEDIDLTIHMRNHGLVIKRLPSLLVGVSMRMAGVSIRHDKGGQRQSQISPRTIINYLAPWPRTYWANHRYVQALLIGLVLFGILLFILPLSCIAWLIQTLISIISK